MKYSAWQIFKQGLSGNLGWDPMWRKPRLKDSYDVIVLGDGAHALATAYELTRFHGVQNMAVLITGTLHSSDQVQGVSLIKSNAQNDQNLAFQSYSRKLWRGLNKTLNFNLQFSTRGVLDLCHDDLQFDQCARRGNAILAHGDPAVLMDYGMVRDCIPKLNYGDIRFPITGGLWQVNGAMADPNALIWAYARAVCGLGIDVIQNCQMTDIMTEKNRIIGVLTNLGMIKTRKLGLAAETGLGALAKIVKMKLPLETRSISISLTDRVKPILNPVVTFGMGQVQLSQNTDGQFVLVADAGNDNRKNWPPFDDAIKTAYAHFPAMGQARVLREWRKSMDYSNDGIPIMDAAEVKGVFVSGGWGRDALQAAPAAGKAFAHLISKQTPHELAVGFQLDRGAGEPNFASKEMAQ